MDIKSTKKTEITFKFSGKVARILGRESIADKVTALSELIKNAYDADATVVKIEMFNLKDPENSKIIIHDNGTGLSQKEFLDKWMIVGTDAKEREPYSSNGRRRVGEKGIGRFSVERLSHDVIIRSEKKGMPEGLEVTINWDEFEKPSVYFDSIPVKVSNHELSEISSGFFEIELKRLRDTWLRKDIEELVRDISFLVSPDADLGEFQIELNIPEYPGIGKKIRPKILDIAYWNLTAKLTETGDCHLHVHFRDGSDKETQISLDKMVCGPIDLAVYFFRLGGTRFFKVTYPGLSLQQVKQTLERHSNIRIYRDSMWVKPYGIPGEDWLGLDQARLKRLADMPSSDQIIGHVKISRDKNPNLIDTTNREGLARGIALEQLKFFIKISLEWAMRIWGLKVEETKKEIIKTEPEITLKAIERLIEKLPAESQSTAKSNIKELRYAVQAKVDRAEKAEALFKIQASLGISLASIMHETGPRVSQATTEFEKIKNEIGTEVPRKERIIINCETGKKALDVVKAYMDYGLGTQQYEIGEIKQCNLSERLEFAKSAFDELFNIWKIKLEINISSDLPILSLRVVEIDSILMNLISNSYSVLRELEGDKKIVMNAEMQGNEFVLTFWDSGPGIPQGKRELVFMEGFTTKRGGTGMGLKIVRDIVESNSGIFYIEDDTRGGTHFTIRIPITKVDSNE